MSQAKPDYSKPGQVLSQAQLEFYNKNGYIVLKNVVSKAELQRYLTRFRQICEGKNVPSEMIVMRDVAIAQSEFKSGEKAITKLQDFNFDPVLFDFCRNQSILDVVNDLIGSDDGNIMSMHTMLINKPPDSGKLTSRHPLHQDLQYFPFRPADYICCAWTAMEKVNRQNGCLVVVPGSHKGRLLDHHYPKWEGGVNKAYYGIQDYDPNTKKVYVEMEAGDTVFFHPILIHGSGTNRTDGFRKAISCHYANGSKCNYIDVTGTNQEVLAKEIVEMAKAKCLKRGIEWPNWSFADVWRVRGRPVGNDRAHL
ncbi:unnamed protein product [Bursaphelenchus okinawaensis]|uniref:phytanoyl-CoA dioxygenase n=1 Tax=Bursaphelenchus okinawaensis TaxID=465554 RepID=A0A811LEZ9_9BILA|nr:unnamed protein product [Bursaphelenchus okinawaensis]CAG9121953.1 unnamed protein product [Bursaphelenchus okinawaensis]